MLNGVWHAMWLAEFITAAVAYWLYRKFIHIVNLKTERPLLRIDFEH